MKVYVVFYDEAYPGYGDRGGNLKVIDNVYDSREKAQARVKELEKDYKFPYVDYDEFEVK